jgi:hypothetical protein
MANEYQIIWYCKQIICFLFHLAFAAFVAIFPCAALPPSRGSGILDRYGWTGACPVNCSTILKVVSLMSLLERLGMAQL